MTEEELHTYLMRTYPHENDACEWKGWERLTSQVSGRKGDDVISYVSALANMKGGVLVIGIADKTGNILGVKDLHDYTPENLPYRLIGNCTNLSSEGLWVEEFITSDTQKTVWAVHIPAHLPRRPVYAHKTAWQRSGDSLIPLRPEREAAILQEPITVIEDWSREICEGATLKDLDSKAIELARANYKVKFPHLAQEVDEWSDKVFLDKARLSINGKITRAAIILLGLPESVHYLASAQTQISWILKDKENVELDYAHFEPPFLLNVEKVFAKIRNLKYRYMRGDSIFPEEVDMYDPYVLREALHNAIAHQDYTMSSRIFVVEFPERLLFVNDGSFIPGSVEAAIDRDAPATQSRNPFLAQAMVNLGMIDTIGSGIKRMFMVQRKRFFPMPDYDLENQKVTVQIYGKVIDLEYARLLARNQQLTLSEIILLDRVQKHKLILDEDARHLREKGYIEGRKPHYHVSSSVARVTGKKAAYIKNKAFDDEHYKRMIIEFIKKFGSASRQEADQLLFDKLSDLLSPKQKRSKVGNLLSALRMEGIIENTGSTSKPKWVLRDPKKP
ncbi:MAG: putative DNA binding domain-containing protein [Lewinellaceae bacterium]|nr:putative DNA binding domain-containing protein [Lewinellaceae bacterium]